jgi:hypothetical protein
MFDDLSANETGSFLIKDKNQNLQKSTFKSSKNSVVDARPEQLKHNPKSKMRLESPIPDQQGSGDEPFDMDLGHTNDSSDKQKKQ